ncbi:hypothetical protein Btru_048137 [Bulinus truncatus]|nr:hypothetical protein Btru_048137 [Bulinus truncatus]
MTQADQFLTLQKIVRRIDDKTVNTAYVHLLCNIELSKLIVTERQTLQSVARVSPKRLLDPYQTDVKFTDDKGNSDERSEYISIYTEGTYSDETYSTSIFSNPYGCFSMNASSIETGYESKNSFSLWNTMESSTKPTAPPLYEAKLFGDLLQPSNTSHGLLQADVKFTDDKGNSDERPEHMSIYTEGTYSDETYSASIFNNDLDFFRLNSKETGQSDYLNLPPQSPYGCFSMNISSIETGYESKNSFSLRNTMESSTKPITPHGHLYEAKLFGDLLQPSNTSHGLLQAESTNQSYDAVSKTRTTRCVGKIPDNKMLKDATDFKEKFGKGHFYSKNKGYFYRNAGFSITKVNSATSTSFLIKAEMIYYLDYLAIIQFMDKITASGPCRTILESAPSGSLNQFFQTDCGMKCLFSDVIRLNAQITKGMTYLEGMKIVLWDLRAEKILVGDHFNIKISDFEYAVQLQNEDSIHFAELCEGIPVGWTAPEAVLEKKFSLKSDVWSFGVVMYETVTLGRTPYSGDMLLRIIKEGKFKEYPENSLVLVPDFYLNIMLECWESARKETKIPLP